MLFLVFSYYRVVLVPILKIGVPFQFSYVEMGSLLLIFTDKLCLVCLDFSVIPSSAYVIELQDL